MAGCYSLARPDLEGIILAAGGKVARDPRVAADRLQHRESLYILVPESAPEEAAQLAVSRADQMYQLNRSLYERYVGSSTTREGQLLDTPGHLQATFKAATVVRPEWLVECVSHMRLLPTARFEFKNA